MGRTPMDNATARSVFVIGPDKRIKATLTYPMSTGRNFAEILRLLDSIPAYGQGAGGHPGQLGAGSFLMDMLRQAVPGEDNR